MALIRVTDRTHLSYYATVVIRYTQTCKSESLGILDRQLRIVLPIIQYNDPIHISVYVLFLAYKHLGYVQRIAYPLHIIHLHISKNFFLKFCDSLG